jgi:hypothetical protein
MKKTQQCAFYKFLESFMNLNPYSPWTFYLEKDVNYFCLLLYRWNFLCLSVETLFVTEFSSFRSVSKNLFWGIIRWTGLRFYRLSIYFFKKLFTFTIFLSIGFKMFYLHLIRLKQYSSWLKTIFSESFKIISKESFLANFFSGLSPSIWKVWLSSNDS